MATVTSSSITFLDFTDQQQLSAYLTSNLSTVQFRGTDDKTYNPSWEDTPLIITLHAFLNQVEVDYVSDDYTFKWYVKDGVKEELLQSGNSKTLVVDSNKLGEAESGMLTYICEISCSNAETITTEITYTLISEGKSVVFSIISRDGTIFKNQSGEIKLETIKYYGVNEITNATFQWYKLTANGEELIQGATQDTYIVFGQDVVNIVSYKCIMTYNGIDYSDVITLQDVSDNYSSDILTIGGTVFKNGIGGSAAYIIVRGNGKEEDALAGVVSMSEPSAPKADEYWYHVDNEHDRIIKKQYQSGAFVEVADIPQTLQYNWYLMDQDGNIEQLADSDGKVVYLACDDVDEITTLCCEVTNKDGKLLTISQETFVDLYDSYNVVITPNVAAVACDNSGGVTQELEYEFAYTVDIQGSQLKAQCVIENIPNGLTVDTTQDGIIKIVVDPEFTFGDVDDISLTATITAYNGGQEFTIERCITLIQIKEGAGAINFRIIPSSGDTFTEGIEHILLSVAAYQGLSAIIEADYRWYYYKDGKLDEPHEIYQIDENGESSLVTTPYLNVSKNDDYAFLPLKCVMEYPKSSGLYYEDYYLLKDYYNPYTATIKFLNTSDVIGINDEFIVAYVELYKNNIVVDPLPTTAIPYYHKDTTINGSTIAPGGTMESSEDGDYRYFVYNVSENDYDIVLGKYSSSSKSFTVVTYSYNYTYINSVYPDLHSKVLLIPKKDITSSTEVVFNVYYNSQTPDDNLLIATSNHVIVNLNEKLGNIPQVVQDVDEYMNFHPDSGLTISQKYKDGTAAPFYVNITSTKMGFHEVSNNEDKEVVYIGNNAANITNLTVEHNADFKTSIDMLNTNASTQATCPGFSLLIEEDGSFSLITLIK